MKKIILGFKRRRAALVFGGTLLAAVLSYLGDPDGGLSTLLGGLALLQAVWAVAAAHWTRKALMDYPEADMRSLFAKAAESAVGAGLALLAIAIVFSTLLTVYAPRASAAELPPGALKYGPALMAERERYWPGHPDPAVLYALVEQESCITLKHPKCWNPAARLKTAREEGAGMGQITRAYRSDGSLRFDTLADLRSRHASLEDMTWQNIYARPDLQLRAMVLLAKEAARPFRQTSAMLEFGDAAYNGGVGGVQKERRACHLSPGCDASKWFGHVERHCLKSRQPLYGGRSACDINREHVTGVFVIRPGKYRTLVAGRFK
jgi:hypothetical protein